MAKPYTAGTTMHTFSPISKFVVTLAVCVLTGKLTNAQLGVVSRVSVADLPFPINASTQEVAISHGGLVSAFTTTASDVTSETPGTNVRQLYVFYRSTGFAYLASRNASGSPTNQPSAAPAISGNGRFVAYENASQFIAPPDANGVTDVFVRDLLLGSNLRVSVSNANVIGNASSTAPAVSHDGRYVAFRSIATNLVPNDTNGVADIFVRDLVTLTTERVSVSSNGTEGNGIASAPSISPDGRYISFTSAASNLVAGDTNAAHDIFVHDRETDTTVRVSVNGTGEQALGTSSTSSISADGTLIAFDSAAPNLVPSDTNGVQDVFLRDTSAGTTTRISVSSAGIQANGTSRAPKINTGGLLVTFESNASNIVANDTNAAFDVFLRNVGGATTTRVSVSSQGSQGSQATYGQALSPDGGSVVFLSNSEEFDPLASVARVDGYLHDTSNLQTKRISGNRESNRDSIPSSVSSNSRFVAFTSLATNLVAGDTNGFRDVFVHDRLLKKTTRVSVSSSGIQGNNISDMPFLSSDGRFVAFWSRADNLVAGDTNGFSDVFVHDRVAGTTTRVSLSSSGEQGNNEAVGIGGSYGYVTMSDDGRFVAFESEATNLISNDANDSPDAFVRDLQTGITQRVSLSYTGEELNVGGYFPTIDGAGSRVAFLSFSADVTPGVLGNNHLVFIRDLQQQTTEIVSVSSGGQFPNSGAFGTWLSGNGRFVAFGTLASNMVPGDTGSHDVFIRDTEKGTTIRASESWSGGQPNGNSYPSRLSWDGRFVAFQSVASNLIPTDTNGWEDVFVRDLVEGVTRRVSVKTNGDEAEWNSYTPFISADGLSVAFNSQADFVPERLNESAEVFVRDVALTPLSSQIVRGNVHAGDGLGLVFDDGERLSLRPGITFSTSQDPIEIVLEATSPEIELTSLEFAVESNATSPNVRQVIELYDFSTEAYVLVHSGQSTVNDSWNRIVISSDVDRFKGPNLELRARIRYRATGPVFAYPWRASLDRVYWKLINDG